MPDSLRRRVVIEGVTPEVDGGRFPAKATLGRPVRVEADVFAEGHDVLAGFLLYRADAEAAWTEVPLEALVNDRWRAYFPVTALGLHHFTLQAWVDHFGTWRRDLGKRIAAGQDVKVELQVGATLVAAAARSAPAADAAALAGYAKALTAKKGAEDAALDPELAALMTAHGERGDVTEYGREVPVWVDRELAGFSAWYELFPRSASPDPGRHGTFRDVEARLPYIEHMGFDILYLPPIHPIGTSFRKGRNNQVESGPDDVGSPWAIGSKAGGHKSIHPELGTLEDFKHLLASAAKHRIEVALDIAFQCSPDHPYVREHPEWFRKRPDGTIQYAENPPKKYQDIYPFDFECAEWQALWHELRSVFDYWIEQGVRIFRVDNPHTKPFRFWEWLIDGLRHDHPDVILLSEAFTRPRVMYELAKLGFTQSYTYFAWRNAGWEIREYLEELTSPPVRDFFRPNFWPNTPDILTDFLQTGGRPAFIQRVVLAATLSSNYGIYGPAFELLEDRPLEAGKEEYLDSEKYQVRHWDLERPGSLRDFIARLNRIRRENPALHANDSLQFHETENEMLLAYSKMTPDAEDVTLMVVNLDPYRVQSGLVHVPLADFGLDPEEPYQVHDLLSDARYTWRGDRAYIELNPHAVPAHILRVRHRLRTERDFEYYL
ncbi:MAG TPA: alpha-1,4-glucan--maltose-1-phosphate maltosyltransferase [Candidatus Dormibacteraeota bacterium]